jgi:hypothetical protein
MCKAIAEQSLFIRYLSNAEKNGIGGSNIYYIIIILEREKRRREMERKENKGKERKKEGREI